jgi:2-octaprenyl-6-methoxyphenol hydroxylase
VSEQILIVGGGPVGMALALALKRGGMNPVLVDAREAGAAGRDPRVLALAPGTRQTLERLGVWSRLAPTQIETIHISQKGGFGRTLLRASDYAMPALGYVVEAGALANSLNLACREAGVRQHHETRVSQVQIEAGCVRATLEGSERSEIVSPSLVAWAEGRLEEGDDVQVRDYRQHGVITLARTREARARTAYERFTEDGPLALLPCGNAYAVVFTCAPEQAMELMAMDDETFLARLQAQFGERLHFVSVEARFSYPLFLRYRPNPVGVRQIWLGNSAQTLHPVGGQGFNLALRDAWQLADTLLHTTVAKPTHDAPLARERERGGGVRGNGAADPGSAEILTRYGKRRSLDRRSTIGFTDLLVRAFSNANPLLALGRGAGLFLLDVRPPARNFVARRMMYGARAWP